MTVLDTSAWLAYLNAEPEGVRVRPVVEGEGCLTPAIVIAELVDQLVQTRKERDVASILDFVRARSTIVDLDFETARLAGSLKREARKRRPGFGLADAIIYAVAVQHRTRVLTKDRDFSGLEHAEFLR